MVWCCSWLIWSRGKEMDSNWTTTTWNQRSVSTAGRGEVDSVFTTSMLVDQQEFPRCRTSDAKMSTTRSSASCCCRLHSPWRRFMTDFRYAILCYIKTNGFALFCVRDADTYRENPPEPASKLLPEPCSHFLTDHRHTLWRLPSHFIPINTHTWTLIFRSLLLWFCAAFRLFQLLRRAWRFKAPIKPPILHIYVLSWGSAAVRQHQTQFTVLPGGFFTLSGRSMKWCREEDVLWI